jgi:hypothetical protein
LPFIAALLGVGLKSAISAYSSWLRHTAATLLGKRSSCACSRAHGRDFGIEPRAGRQAVSSPDSVELLMSCYPDIVFVIDESHWSRDTAVPVVASALT